MNRLFTILFLFSAIYANSQNVLQDISQLKSVNLSPNFTVISVNSKIDTLIDYYIFIDFPVKLKKDFPAEFEYIAYIQGFETQSPDQFYLRLVSDTNAVDSTLKFVHTKLFSPSFTPDNFDNFKEKALKKFENPNYNEEFDVQSKQIPYSQSSLFYFAKKDDFEALNMSNVYYVYNTLLNSSNICLVAVGNTNFDTIITYAKQDIIMPPTSEQLSEQEILKYEQSKKFSFITDNNVSLFNVKQTFEYYYTDADFTAKSVLIELLNNKFIDFERQMELKCNSEILIRPNGGYLSYSFQTENASIFDITLQIADIFNNAIINEPSSEDLQSAVRSISQKFNNSLKNPFYPAYYAYIITKNNLPKDFFSTYYSNLINVTSSAVLASAKEIIKPDSLFFLLRAPYFKNLCDFLELARFYQIEFFDNNYRKYKIIPLGFDASYIINDYITKCNAKADIQNLKIDFHADFKIDTTYKIIGQILKKAPKYYFYKTILIAQGDTLFHQLTVANAKFCIDSSAIGCKFYNDRNEFWQEIYRTSIFPEMYYNQFNYSTQILCDTTLLKKNIYKIKVTTPFNLFYVDYYDFNSKLKLKTEVIKPSGFYQDTLQIIEYKDYNNISKDSDIKLPYTIEQTSKDYSVIIKIDAIDDKTKIKMKNFNVKLKK